MNAPISPADRAVDLWGRWQKQYGVCRSKDWPGEEVALLNEIERDLHAEMDTSVDALAVVLMIETVCGREEVPGLMCAALAAIRPQLGVGIGETADRVMAQDRKNRA